jgi:hypothetical protein
VLISPCPECNGSGKVPSRASRESDKRQGGPSIHIHFD